MEEGLSVGKIRMLGRGRRRHFRARFSSMMSRPPIVRLRATMRIMNLDIRRV